MAKRTLINKKNENFPEWYNEVIFKAKVVDNRYPLKGCYVWYPYGFKALKKMLHIMEHLLDTTGHEEAYFPSLVPASVFSKESDFLEGFTGETLRITHVGKKKLREELVFRPTSETVMYEMFAQWIKGKSDLPLKIYQTVNVFRYETKQTRPLLRVREIIKFKEAHTVHATEEEADQQIQAAIDVYKAFFDALCLSYKILRTPPWDTFPGALYNYDFITVMPDKKALELASVINLGQKFAKTFNIQFMDEDGQMKYPVQTCYGISERSLGAVIAILGDDKGMVLPPAIAPIDVVIVPIVKSDNSVALGYADEVAAKLKRRTAIVDKGNDTPGEKYYKWELKGVPLRIEVGPREVENREVLIVDRFGNKRSCSLDEVELVVKEMLDSFEQSLKQKASAFFNENVHVFETMEQAKAHVRSDGQNGLVGIPWCGEKDCALGVEQQLDTPCLGYEKGEGLCPICGKKAKHIMYYGRTY